MTTKKATKTVKRRKKGYWTFVNDIASYLKEHFYLHAWTIHVVSIKKVAEASNFENRSGDEVIASMVSDGMYMDATLSLYPGAHKKWKDGKYESLGRVLVHEFSHVLTDPLYKIACEGVSRREGPNLEHVRENTTQHFANIVWPGIDKRIFSPYKVTRKGGK